MSEENIFYVYEHWRPDTGQCFYVGKGSGRRAWCMRRTNRHHLSIISKLTSLGLAVDVRIVIGNLSEETALSLEADRIAIYPKSQLANKTSGGTGKSGWKLSEEARQEISKKAKGRKLTDEHKAKVGAFFRGKKLSPEHIAKMSLAQKGRRPSDATIAASVAALKGKKRRPELVEKTAAYNRGRKLSPEHCAAISAGQKGRTMSEEQKVKLRLAWRTRPPMSLETRKKLSNSVTVMWQKRKAAM